MVDMSTALQTTAPSQRRKSAQDTVESNSATQSAGTGRIESADELDEDGKNPPSRCAQDTDSSLSTTHPLISEQTSLCTDKTERIEINQYRDTKKWVATDSKSIKRDANDESPQLSFAVSKFVILRLLGLVYAFVFASAYYQNIGLMGDYGLQPARHYLDSILSRPQDYHQHKTLFVWWILPLNDTVYTLVTLTGLVISIVVACGINSCVLQLILWVLDFSIVSLAEGTSFYQYGWESQLLETGFLAIFLCALPTLYTTATGSYRLRLNLWETWTRSRDSTHNNTHVHDVDPSLIVLWLFSWLSFRISLGAGLIKLRGSSCWHDRTCLHSHFETQPIPSPLSFVYHFCPRIIQSLMVDVDFIVQLYTSWMVLVPAAWIYRACKQRWVRLAALWTTRVGGWMQAGFMVGIALSGNFAILNHLTIVPALACIEDKAWPRWIQRMVNQPDASTKPSPTLYRRHQDLFSVRSIADAILLTTLLSLSWPVIANLLQIQGYSHQLMNASFNQFRLVNTYGAFGSVGLDRYEAIVSVSDDGRTWLELEFPCKPGNLKRRPCFSAPYHYRLDWNIWFLGFKPHRAYLERREQWVYHLLLKLIQTAPADTPRPWLDLLATETASKLQREYYSKGQAPRYAKADMYQYWMTGSLWKIVKQHWSGEDTVWWRRAYEEALIPPLFYNATIDKLRFLNTM
jgi:Lipase maturation factor